MRGSVLPVVCAVVAVGVAEAVVADVDEDAVAALDDEAGVDELEPLDPELEPLEPEL